MKATASNTAKTIQNANSTSDVARREAPPSAAASGRLAQLAAMMNQSPRVQTQMSLAAEINHAEAPPAQLRVKEEEAPAQREEARAPNRSGLPDQLKSGVERLSGLSLDDVKVHYNSDKPAQLNALAYAQGTDIHVAPGQEKHLPHEAWHIVQQKQGRAKPTMQMKGIAVNDARALEREADGMGRKASGKQLPSGRTRAKGLRAMNSNASPATVQGMFVFSDENEDSDNYLDNIEQFVRSVGEPWLKVIDESPRIHVTVNVRKVVDPEEAKYEGKSALAYVDGERVEGERTVKEWRKFLAGTPQAMVKVDLLPREGQHIGSLQAVLLHELILHVQPITASLAALPESKLDQDANQHVTTALTGGGHSNPTAWNSYFVTTERLGRAAISGGAEERGVQMILSMVNDLMTHLNPEEIGAENDGAPDMDSGDRKALFKKADSLGKEMAKRQEDTAASAASVGGTSSSSSTTATGVASGTSEDQP